MESKYIGWRLGINYQVPDPQGLDLAYIKKLIDRSADFGMNFISFMMLSYACFCPEHDGYAWPVQNPKLKPLKDFTCDNADITKEFLSKALCYAKKKGFHCQLFMNSMIWNPEKVKKSYDKAESQCFSNGQKARGGWVFCPDSPGAWQLALDEVADLLTFYADYPVDSYGFERLSYCDSNTCYCKYSKENFKRDTGYELENTSKEMEEAKFNHLIWKGNSIRRYIKKYVTFVKEICPNIKVWAHTGGEPEWGHSPNIFTDIDIELISNHGQDFITTQKAYYQQLDWLSPFSLVPQICVRDTPTTNYPVPIRTPKSIQENIKWLKRYPGNRIKGIIFFNEVNTSERNKFTVYNEVKNLKSLR